MKAPLHFNQRSLPLTISTSNTVSKHARADRSANSRRERNHSMLSCKALGSSNENYIIKPPAAPIGVIGGMSAMSTVVFLERLVWLSDESCLPFIICNDPFLAGSTRPEIIENIAGKSKVLEHLGAKCIVIPSHQSLLWHHEVSERCSLPVLHIGESVVSELRASRLRPLEAGTRNPRIGVLAISFSSSANFYQEKLRNEGYEVVLPDKQTTEQILSPAIECAKRDKEVRAANKVILACDELQGLIPRNDPLLRKCINPLDCLAISTIKWANNFIKI